MYDDFSGRVPPVPSQLAHLKNWQRILGQPVLFQDAMETLSATGITTFLDLSLKADLAYFYNRCVRTIALPPRSERAAQ